MGAIRLNLKGFYLKKQDLCVALNSAGADLVRDGFFIRRNRGQGPLLQLL
jgi:hypothetical protein